MMDRQLSHMVRLIDDLLDVSRISRNKMELRRGPLLLADVVNSAVETARPVIDAEGHELTVSLPQRPVFLDADLTRLAQVFSNLLTNSAKYTERGGRIWLTAERNEGGVVMSVRDNGIGIPAESLGNIFDMFSQVDRTIERSTGGLGIGLALVKGLVEMHGGTVTAESGGPGRGSTFTVRLPAVGAVRSRLPRGPPQGVAPAAGSGRRILVVDDNRDSADAGDDAEAPGQRRPDRARRHRGGRVGREFRPRRHPDGRGHARLNGYDATRRIREQPWGRRIDHHCADRMGPGPRPDQSREAGCDGHLVKPVDLPDLEKLLTELTEASLSREPTCAVQTAVPHT